MKLVKILILSLYILQPWLLGGVIRIEVSVIFLSFLLLAIKGRLELPGKEFILTLFFLMFVLLITVVHNEFDISFFKKMLSVAFVLIGGFWILKAFDVSLDDLSDSICFVVLFCFIYYVLSIYFPFFRDLSLLLKGETYGIENKLEVYRLWFPTSAHTFHLGLFFFLTTVFLVFENKNIFFILLSVTCASISARSAMLLVVSFLILYFLLKDKRYIIALFVMFPVIWYFINYISSEFIEVKYALEPIINFIQTGALESSSSDDLLEKHLYIPAIREIMIGTGIYTDELTGAFFGHTDSGMMRPLLYGGFIFQLIYMSIIYRYFRTLFHYGLMGVISVVMFFVANIKAELITSTPYFSLVVLIYYLHRKNLCSNK